MIEKRSLVLEESKPFARLITRTQTESGVRQSVKFVSFQEVASALSSNFAFDTGMLPEGIMRIAISKSKTILMFRRKSVKCRVTVRASGSSGSGGGLFRFPPAVMLVYASRRDRKFIPEASRCLLYALKNSENLDDGIYSFPFWNLYPDGKVCFGSSSIGAPVTDLRDLGKLYTLYLASNFNTDLPLQAESGEYEKIYKAMEKQDRFPEQYLKRVDKDGEKFLDKLFEKYSRGQDDRTEDGNRLTVAGIDEIAGHLRAQGFGPRV